MLPVSIIVVTIKGGHTAQINPIMLLRSIRVNCLPSGRRSSLRGRSKGAQRVTRTPGAMAESDVHALRSVGLDDVGVHHAIQVVSFFNFINRIADGVHVDLDPGMPPYPTPPAGA